MTIAKLARLVVLAGLTTPALARAEGPADSARAEALFQEGTKLLDEGKVKEACERFAESRKLAVAVGVTLYLADCYENLGRTATAQALFREAEKMAIARRDRRENVAHERAEKLEPFIPSLALRFAQVPEGVTVTLDGAPLPHAVEEPQRIDPGPHTLRVTAPHKVAFQTQLKATATSTTIKVDVPVLADADEPAHHSAPPFWTTQKIVGAGVAGAGVASVAVGFVFGAIAKGKLDDSNADGHCGPDNRCDAVGLQLRSDGDSAATVANVTVGVGLVAMAGGAFLFFWPKPLLGGAATVTPTARGAALAGQF